MTFRQVVRPGQQDDVKPHEHDASDVSGTFGFFRALRAVIDGDLTLRGFFRTDTTGQRIEIRPAGTEGGLVPSVAFFTGATFATNEPFIEVEDQGGGVWALKLVGPVGTAATDTVFMRLQSNGALIMSVEDQIQLVIDSSVVGTLTASGLELSVPIILPDGDATNPSITFDSDTGVGLFYDNGDIGIAI